MSATEQPPIYLTILRQGDVNILDLAETGSLIPRSQTQVDSTFLGELVAEIMHLATRPGAPFSQDSGVVVQELQRIGGLIFSHLLTEPARKKLRTSGPCDLYLRLDEQLIHVPWELGHDGNDFLATKFRVGRQVITGYAIPETNIQRETAGPLRVLLIADPTESLPKAGEEADQLCAQLDQIAGVEVTLLGGRGVRRVPLLAALQAHDVVHFAGHSHYDPQNPSQSGWRLHEGVLTAGELSRLSRSPVLVFSNSCQAGATAEWKGGYRYEGQAFGIGSAFLLAGVQNYIGTFWVVHDEESVLFAAAFYRCVVAGLSVGEALLQARQAVIQQRGWQSVTWASYMLYGNPAFTLLPAATEQLHPLPSPSDSTIQQEQLVPMPDEPKPPEATPPEATSLLKRVEELPGRTLSQPGTRKFAAVPSTEVKRNKRSADEDDTATSHPFISQLKKSIGSSPRRVALAVAVVLLVGAGAGVFRQLPFLQNNSFLSQEVHHPRAIGVMHFKALRADPHLDWMRDAIRDAFNSQLSSVSDLKVYSKEYIDFLVQKDPTTEIAVANQLGIAKMISGSFLAIANTLRIEAHVVDVESGLIEASAYVEGEQSDFFHLHRQLAFKIMDHLNIAAPPEATSSTGTLPPASLDAYKLLLEAEGETPPPGPASPEPPPTQDSSPQESDTLSCLPLEGRWIGTSVAWAQEIPQQEHAPEEEIRQVLERYRQAYEEKNLALLSEVYDTLTTAQQEANAKYFQHAKNLQVTIRDIDIAVRGNEAAVSYTREDQFVDAETGRSVMLEVRLTKILTRADGLWKITHRNRE